MSSNQQRVAIHQALVTGYPRRPVTLELLKQVLGCTTTKDLQELLGVSWSAEEDWAAVRRVAVAAGIAERET